MPVHIMRTRITLNMDIFHAVFSRNFLILFLVFVSWRVVINKIPASGFWLLNIGHKLEKNVDFGVSLLSILVTDPSFMSISLLVLDLWQFLFIRDWPGIRKLEITTSVLWLIFEDWGELRVPNLAAMCVMKSYLMLPRARFTALTVSKL